MRVVVFYIKEHSGHHKAAEAISLGFTKWAPEVTAIVKNSSDFFDPRVRDFIETLYMSTIRYLPWIWSWMYDNETLKRHVRSVKRLNVFLDKRKLLRFIRDNAPDAILCTQAVPCEMISILKSREMLRVPLIAVPTDFYVHSYWIHSEVDAYFVASERSKQDLIQRNVDPSQIAVTGIPVRPDFVERGDRANTRRELGLDEHKKTVLMMGGGNGLLAYAKLIDSIVRVNPDLQIISVLGAAGKRQDSIRSKLESDHVRALGYVDNVPALMDASDVIVSKPGGLTCAEVLIKGLPFVMTSPLPGQEEKNLSYMLGSGAGIYAETPRKVALCVQNILGAEGVAENLSSHALAFSRPNAAYDVVTKTLERCRL